MTTQRSPSAAKRRRKPPSKNALIWGSLFVVVGGVLLVLGGWSAKLGFETTKWPLVAATIVDSKVSVSEEHDSSHPRSRRESLYLTVAYSYEVGGREYAAGGLERGALGSGDEYPVRKRWGMLSVGQKVTVAVNPADPGEAYLVPGVSNFAYILGGPGLAMVFFGMMFFATYRAGRKSYLAQGDQTAR